MPERVSKNMLNWHVSLCFTGERKRPSLQKEKRGWFLIRGGQKTFLGKRNYDALIWLDEYLCHKKLSIARERFYASGFKPLENCPIHWERFEFCLYLEINNLEAKGRKGRLYDIAFKHLMKRVSEQLP